MAEVAASCEGEFAGAVSGSSGSLRGQRDVGPCRCVAEPDLWIYRWYRAQKEQFWSARVELDTYRARRPLLGP
eukprot:5955674-Lingulodinium_polyedra.AAC.1